MRFLCSIVLALFFALQGGVAAAETPGFDKAKKHTDQGEAEANNSLGDIYADRHDYQEAVKWYRLAAAQGYAPAQYNLGAVYALGEGVPQDYRKAVHWYRLAAEQGNAVAQSSLGVLYAQGEGVPQDYKKAVHWYRLAAEQGNAAAQTNLGVVYGLGEGVRKDLTIADMWFIIAAKNGDGSGAAARDQLALELTDAAIAKIQEMARVCMGSDYRDCGVK